MKKIQLLCTTMFQNDFSLLSKMNIKTDVIFLNQSEHTSVNEIAIDNCHKAMMISTQTRGVGVNRNLGLIYADAEICLLADDDMLYDDNLEMIVCREFEKYRGYDVIIFQINNEDGCRRVKESACGRRYRKYMPIPWGAPCIAFKLSSIKKKNIWFTTLFGGGCKYSNGEDSIFITDLVKNSLKIYISDKVIGTLTESESTWFSGAKEYYYYSKGALYEACHKKTKWIWMLYFAFRTSGMTELSFFERLKWMHNGIIGFQLYLSYEEFVSKYKTLSL